MEAIDDVYADLDADVSKAEFRTAVEEKVEQMGGLADAETAALLIAHELEDDIAETIADLEPGMEEVEFHGKVTRIGDLRTFERDEDEDGQVINVTVADETGDVRLAFWDGRAEAVANGEIDVGDVLHVGGRPREGYAGVEVHVDRAEVADDVAIDVGTGETTIDDLSLGSADVTVRGQLLDVGPVRTFDRDDGDEGQVRNATIGDATGRTRLTCWDERTADLEDLDPGETVAVHNGYVRERDGDLELHVGGRGSVEPTDDAVEYTPEVDPIDAVEIGEDADIRGVVRSADPKRTFDRDDGSEGQVRNIRIQDSTDDIRVALWGDKADRDVGPGDEVLLTDVEIQDGWQDDREASAGWGATLTVLDGGDGDLPDAGGAAGSDSSGTTGRTDDRAADSAGGAETDPDTTDATGLNAFAGTESADADPDTVSGGSTEGNASGGSSPADDETGGSSPSAGDDSDSTTTVERTGAVVQPGDPVIIDTGDETVAVETDADLELGREVAVRGSMEGDRLVAAAVREVPRESPSE